MSAPRPLHDILVRVVEEVGGACCVRGGEDNVQTDIEGLPGMAHCYCVVVQCVQLLDALEAVVDIERFGCQDVAGIDALLDPPPHVVVLEGQAVAALESLDHPVLAVPCLCPAASGVHGTIGHGAVKVV